MPRVLKSKKWQSPDWNPRQQPAAVGFAHPPLSWVHTELWKASQGMMSSDVGFRQIIAACSMECSQSGSWGTRRQLRSLLRDDGGWDQGSNRDEGGDREDGVGSREIWEGGQTGQVV